MAFPTPGGIARERILPPIARIVRRAWNYPGKCDRREMLLRTSPIGEFPEMGARNPLELRMILRGIPYVASRTGRRRVFEEV